MGLKLKLAWIDSAGNLQVLSYYNRRTKSGWTSLASDISTIGNNYPNYAEVSTTLRNSFISWADEEVLMYQNASVSISSAMINVFVGVGVDGVTIIASGYSTNNAAANYKTMTLTTNKTGLTEAAIHYATLLGSSNSATLPTYYGASLGADGAGCRIGVTIKG